RLHRSQAVSCAKAHRSRHNARRPASRPRRSARSGCIGRVRVHRARFTTADPPKTSSAVGYVTDFGLGSNDPTGPPSIPGSSIFDADRRAPGAGLGCLADYSSFLLPFKTSSPGPKGASGPYTAIVKSSLTGGLSLGTQEGDSVGDANIFTAFEGPWCASITAEN